jgi:hypothetical protein
VDVIAKEPWNDTKLDVAAGETMRVTANGTWFDAKYSSGPDGYSAPWWLRIWDSLRRCPEAGWFELTGEIDRGKGQTFPIGTRDTVTMPAHGRLYLYANDVSGFYWNNSGKLDVTIERAT